MESLNRCGILQLWAKSSLSPDFINKDLWDHLQTHALFIVYICFHTTKAELRQDDIDCIAQKVKNIYHLALYSKNLLIPGLKDDSKIQ